MRRLIMRHERRHLAIGVHQFMIPDELAEQAPDPDVGARLYELTRILPIVSTVVEVAAIHLHVSR
jgi:hypothetical protein